jgi:hypothetical protein
LGDFESPKAEALGYPEANTDFSDTSETHVPEAGHGAPGSVGFIGSDGFIGSLVHWFIGFVGVWLVLSGLVGFTRMGEAMPLSSTPSDRGEAMPLEHWRGLMRIE